MNDLVQSMVLSGGQWTGSSEHLEGPDDISTGKRRKELGSMAFSTTSINFATVNSAAGLRSKQLLNNKGIGRTFSQCDVVVLVVIALFESVCAPLFTFFSSK